MIFNTSGEEKILNEVEIARHSRMDGWLVNEDSLIAKVMVDLRQNYLTHHLPEGKVWIARDLSKGSSINVKTHKMKITQNSVVY